MATLGVEVALGATFFLGATAWLLRRKRRGAGQRKAGKKDPGVGGFFQLWDGLDKVQRAHLLDDVKDVDLAEVQRLLQASQQAAEGGHGKQVLPLADDAVFKLNRSRPNWMMPQNEESPERRPLFDRGLELIAEGVVAVLCLAGGQGTRLGSSQPKGMFNIGLPSGKSLFQLQAERIGRMQILAAHVAHQSKEDIRHRIPWVILTSPATDAQTREFFQDKSFFKLDPEQVHFVIQDELPCLTEEGKIIVNEAYEAARAPNGNGGLFAALVKSGVLDKLEAQGVGYVDTYCVDNALARVADPHFVGLASMKNADVCAKVVSKAYPEEKVGVFAVRDGHTEVVEYSELDPEEASATDPERGTLKYNWSNISSFCFTPDFIRRAQADLEQSGRYHMARKEIPSATGPVKGIKLESFIFDPLPLAHNLVLMEADRSANFAPVKNANGSAVDTPKSARDAVLALHRRWVEAFGGKVDISNGGGPEVSPTKSYLGESLDYAVDGRTFTCEYDAILQGDITDRNEIARLVKEELHGKTPPPPASSLRRLRTMLPWPLK